MLFFSLKSKILFLSHQQISWLLFFLFSYWLSKSIGSAEGCKTFPVSTLALGLMGQSESVQYIILKKFIQKKVIYEKQKFYKMTWVTDSKILFYLLLLYLLFWIGNCYSRFIFITISFCRCYDCNWITCT